MIQNGNSGCLENPFQPTQDTPYPPSHQSSRCLCIHIAHVYSTFSANVTKCETALKPESNLIVMVIVVGMLILVEVNLIILIIMR